MEKASPEEQRIVTEMIESPVLMGVFDRLRDQYTETLLKSNPDDSEMRERLYQAVWVLDEVKGQLQHIAGGGRNDRLSKFRNGRQ